MKIFSVFALILMVIAVCSYPLLAGSSISRGVMNAVYCQVSDREEIFKWLPEIPQMSTASQGTKEGMESRSYNYSGDEKTIIDLIRSELKKQHWTLGKSSFYTLPAMSQTIISAEKNGTTLNFIFSRISDKPLLITVIAKATPPGEVYRGPSLDFGTESKSISGNVSEKLLNLGTITGDVTTDRFDFVNKGKVEGQVLEPKNPFH